jgi:serine/threonine-protein kinase
MPFIQLQSEEDKAQGVYYEYNPEDMPLGEGGMGKVYKGWRCSVNNGQRREVAIKFLYSDLPPHVIARARREAAVQLRNDNLIEMIGFLEIQGVDILGQKVIRYHVVSEFLHGVSLSSILEGKVTDYKGDVIPYAQELYEKYHKDPYHFALIVIQNLLSGLMALHDAGYIHRDIDPSNIMVTSDEHIKLIDYGIAKKINGKSTKESTYTQTGQFIGKPQYAAPELARGLVDDQGVCTDLYAVGILFYQLVVGHVPFDGEMAEILDMQLNKPLPLGDLKQKALRNVIKTATQKKKAARYQSAAEFRVAVEKLTSLPYPEQTINPKLIKMGSIGAAAVVVLAAAITGIVQLIGSGGGDEPVSDSTVSVVSFEHAYTLLMDSTTTADGFSELKALAEQDDSKALFLLSRLYYQDIDDTVEDTLQQIKTANHIQPDNKHAHELLRKAVLVDEKNYLAQYELGLDYKSNYRGTTRNNDSAFIELSLARKAAYNAGDSICQEIEYELENSTNVNDTIRSLYN